MDILEIKILKLITHWWYNSRLDTAEEENENSNRKSKLKHTEEKNNRTGHGQIY